MPSSPHHEFDYEESRSCCRTQCNCFCGTGTCRFCCRGCPPAKESTLTRGVYITFLVLCIITMAMFMSENIQNAIMELFSNRRTVCEWLGAKSACHAGKIIGYLAVYRIGFAISLYHLVLMVSTYGVKTSKECRASFHNGLWIYKAMLFVVTCLLAFFISDSEDHFINVWMYVAMTGAATFIVIQLLLIVFMVHSLTDKIQEKVEKGENEHVWYTVLTPAVATFLYILCLSGVSLLFIYFASEGGCYKNQWFIMINVGGCFIVSLVSAVRKDHKPVGLRLLHASLISLYVVYLTWMAISSAPRSHQDNMPRPRPSVPSYSSRLPYDSRNGRFRDQYSRSFQPNFYCGPNGEEDSWSDSLLPYLSFVITFATVIYGSIGISEPENCDALALPDCPTKLTSSTGHPIDDSGGQMVIRNEKKALVYSYSLFHLMMTLVCLLMMMHLTSWHTPTSASLATFGRSWSAAWIKMASSWICLLLYFVSLLCPSILPRWKDNQPVAPVIIEVNGYAYGSDSDDSFIEDAAVPLTLSLKPTIISLHQETQV